MNAIAAVYGGAPDSGRAVAAGMIARMPARAAGRAIFFDTPYGAAGVSGSAPSLAETADGISVAGDLRIINRAELRASLGLPAGVDDASIACAAYERHGLAFARELIGEFAFVLLDRRERRMIAVRDALGLRPLHYRRDGDVLRIASDLGALTVSGDALDEGFLAEVLAGDVVDREGTAYAAIRRVPPAHLLVADARGVRVARYWEPAFAINSGSLADHADRLRATFDRAVRDSSDGARQIGVHLSGGLDSSSVLGSVMDQGIATPVVGANIFPWPEADERTWIAASAARWGITPHLVEPDTAPAAHDLGSIARHGDLPDHPHGAPLLAPLHRRMVRDGSVDVVLSGLGGDQWWSGESAHMADLLRTGRWRALGAWRRAGASMGELEWSWPAFVSDGLLPLVPAPSRRLVRRVRPRRPPPWIDAAFAARVHLIDRQRRRPSVPREAPESWRRLRWRLDSGEEALAHERLDRMSIAHGVDVRHPMYDRRLVELAFATPDEARIAGGRARAVLREAMRDRLARETVARSTKADFSRILTAAAASPGVARHLPLPALSELGWVDRAVAQSIVDRARDDLDVAMTFWSLAGVEAWLHHAFGAE